MMRVNEFVHASEPEYALVTLILGCAGGWFPATTGRYAEVSDRDAGRVAGPGALA